MGALVSIWTCDHACQQFFKVGHWKRYFEVDCQDDSVGEERQASDRDAFFRAREGDLAKAGHDAVEEANRVQGFGEHRSAVLPWLRETGIVDRGCALC